MRFQLEDSIRYSDFSRSAILAFTETPLSDARLRRISMAAGEPSTAVTLQPCFASQSALRPDPQARSRALPGDNFPADSTKSGVGAASKSSDRRSPDL